MSTLIKIFILFILIAHIIISFSPMASAGIYTSPSFTLRNARVVCAGGNASSQDYLLNNVMIGNLSGGKAQSANYSLDLSKDINNRPLLPQPPTLNPVTTPANVATQTLSGGKEAGSAIYINGYPAVPLTTGTTWSYNYNLTEGENILLVTARNASGLDSSAVSATILLDTILPSINNVTPADGSLFEIGDIGSLNILAADAGSGALYYKISIDGTIILDWTTTPTFSWYTFQKTQGVHDITVYVKDRAANESSQSLQVYLVRKAVDLP